MKPPVPIRKRGVVAVIVRDERLLVIRRSIHVRAPGMHCFPGGAIDPGEDEATAIVREMREELNVDIAPARKLWQAVTSWGVDLAWWRVHLAEGAELLHNPAEVEAFYWMTAAEIRALPTVLESNLHFLDAVDRGEIVLD
jgi:8-oxo-dGTP pyrophosphatase MutT (NUDIX family)